MKKRFLAPLLLITLMLSSCANTYYKTHRQEFVSHNDNNIFN